MSQLASGVRLLGRSLGLAGSLQAAAAMNWLGASGLATAAAQQCLPVLQQQLSQELQQQLLPVSQQHQHQCQHYQQLTLQACRQRPWFQDLQQQQCRHMSSFPSMDDRYRHSTTILCVRNGPEVVIIGDGQATQQDFIVKSNVRKVRKIGTAAVGGFAGVAVDGLALLERLEAKLEEHPGQLQRAAVELAKMWRQDKLLRELDASLIVADAQTTLWLMGNGDVLEAGADGVIGIGSGADFAESAARALLQLYRDQQQQQPEQQTVEQGPGGGAAAGDASGVYGSGVSLFDVAKTAMKIAADSCVYTNENFSWYHIQPDGDIVSGGNTSAAAAASAEPVKTSG